MDVELLAVILGAAFSMIGFFAVLTINKHKEIDSRFLVIENKIVEKFTELNKTLVELNLAIQELKIKDKLKK